MNGSKAPKKRHGKLRRRYAGRRRGSGQRGAGAGNFSAVIDYWKSVPMWTLSPSPFMGRSFGGYWAAKMARRNAALARFARLGDVSKQLIRNHIVHRVGLQSYAMKFLIKLLLVLIVLLPVAFAATVFLAVDTQPSINRAAEVTPESIERAKRILDRNDPRKLQPGARRTISVSAQDLDDAANYLARQYAGGGARVDLKGGRAHLGASVRLPALPLGLYLNLQTELTESASLARVDSLRIGQLPVPGWLAEWMIPRLLDIVIDERDLRSFRRAIKKISIGDDRVALTYEWQADLPERLRTVFLPAEDRERLRIYQQRLADVTKAVKSSSASFTELLVPLFTLAEERSSSANAVAENRAVILLLALYINGQDLAGIVPNAKTWPRPQRHGVLLNGRADLAKHFIVSSALAAKAGGPLSDAVGLYKELADAREGSGFSFNDIAADRAGTRFGEYAADSASARSLQQRARSGFGENDVMPATHDLPEYMPEREFIRRFGGVDAPAYNKMMADIERRIAALPLYR
jgi:hypothetical protein